MGCDTIELNLVLWVEMVDKFFMKKFYTREYCALHYPKHNILFIRNILHKISQVIISTHKV